MSLQVWLPLDGNLKNLGVSKNNFIFSHLVGFTDNGKTGKCLTSNIVSSNTSLPTILMSNTKYSMCSWINTNLGGKWIWYMGGGSGTSRGLWIESNGTISFAYNGSEAFISDISVNDNAWHHICLTCDGTNGKMYIDGVYHKGSNSIRVDNAGANDIRLYGANCSLCDFRIYDHCLSAQEVKKISQGLVIHYPLNNNGRGKSNLILRVTPGGGNDPSNISSRGNGTYINDYSLIIQGKNSDTYFSLWTPIDLINNNIYTLSAFVEGLKEGTSYSFSLYAENNTSMGVFTINKNGWNSLTFVKNYNSSNSVTGTYNNIMVYRILIDDSSRTIGSGQGSFTIKAIKLEEGNVRTPFIPHVSSSQYTSFNLGDNVQADISGFGNNGIRNNITYDYLTKVKYGKSAIFNGNDSVITLGNISNLLQDKFTINLWFCKKDLGTKNYETLFGGPSGFEMDTRAGSGTTLSLYMASTRGGTLFTPFNFSNWYMITMVCDNINQYYYINGNLVSTITKKGMPSGNYFIGAWQDASKQNYKGNMSDFRLYTTALSADDIKELYNYNNPIVIIEEEGQDVGQEPLV